ncbi:hypothetical protein L596_021653 [Steinernema carpocapsae]|uniref:Uncharacterized protein n=1 Tax=Steinernema carpocapsae TaxID=34508 RepID=A0A4U5MJF9_STECR|nr:hypothetical protein L596_021653 [Steinernema carpocapsae]
MFNTTHCFRIIAIAMVNTTKSNEAAEKNDAGAAEKKTSEATEKTVEAPGKSAAEAAEQKTAEKTAQAAAGTFRPAPALTPLTVNGRRVFVLRRGQLQALQREVSQQRGMTESLQPQQGEVAPCTFQALLR